MELWQKHLLEQVLAFDVSPDRKAAVVVAGLNRKGEMSVETSLAWAWSGLKSQDDR